jgi:hypothetical protein
MYVAFQSLYATDLCGTVNSTMYPDTTIGFDLSELSTKVNYYTTSPVTYWQSPATVWSTSDVPWTKALQEDTYMWFSQGTWGGR